MSKLLQKFNRTANRHAGKAFLVGTALIALRNWQLWQIDRALVQKLRAEQQPVPKLSRTPKVSVLVAAWNEAKTIDAHIQSFLALTYPDIELILCAGGKDDTYSRAQIYADERIKVLRQCAGEGKQRSLAHAYKFAQGEIIYLTDADCIYDNEVLVRVLAPLIEEGEQVVTGTSRPLDRQLSKVLPVNIWSASTVVSAHSPKYVDGLLGRNAAVSRQALEQSGGLDFEAHTGTDYQLAKRLLRSGNRICYVGESVIASEFPETLGIYRHKQSRWLRNLLMYGRHYKASKDINSTVMTIAAGIIMLLAPFTLILQGGAVSVLWVLVMLNTIFSRIRYTLFTTHLYRLHLPAHFFLTIVPVILFDFTVWALAAFDLLFAERRKRW